MTEPTVEDLRESVEELRSAVMGLATRVGSLSDSLNDLNVAHAMQDYASVKSYHAGYDAGFRAGMDAQLPSEPDLL